MRLYNLRDSNERVSFKDAVMRGLGRNRGLFAPQSIKPLPDVESLLALGFAERSAHILKHLIGDELPLKVLREMTRFAFSAPTPLHPLADGSYALELFHGPTLAFKDFGARFMSQCLSVMSDGERVTILTATSGDTGAAVAHAFYQAPMIDVVILYPEGRVSPLQERLFCTLGDNIHTFSVKGDFDQCQALVKSAFADDNLRRELNLNSANSINISRLLAQVCYYFEASAQLSRAERARAVLSVPSGNFGNLTAGLIARALGLPARRFIAATNANDTVPRYLSEGAWRPHPTRATLSNAMDVSEPSNWARAEVLMSTYPALSGALNACAVSDEETRAALLELHALGYLSEPHGAVAWSALKRELSADEIGIFLCTAHPAKFREVMETLLGTPLKIPERLGRYAARSLLSRSLSPSLDALREALERLFS